jgi:hypothetical protein
MSDTVHLALPLLEASQAQKHVTHNEALERVDALSQLAVISRTLSAPPASPVEGDRYLIAASPTAAWTGHAGELAYRAGGAWQFATPRTGWRVWVEAESAFLVFDGSAWSAISGGGGGGPLQNLPLVGINTTADAANKLSVSSDNVLLTHAGSSVRLKLNKNAAADTASLLYQDSFSGRAELGLTGDDNFHFKVSPDGTAWTEAIVIDRTSGQVTLAANSVANAALADMPSASLKGRSATGTGDPEDLTAAQAAALLPAFTAADKGLAPASGGGTANFLRADGAWTNPMAAAASFQPLLSHLVTNQTDCAYVCIGDSLTNGPTRFFEVQAQLMFARYPQWTLQVRRWDDAASSYLAPVTLQTGSGARTCTLFHASVSGSKAMYLCGDKLGPAITDNNPLLVMASYGHNHSTSHHTRDFLDLVGSIRDLRPVPIILIGQTPTLATNEQEPDVEAARSIASLTGCGFIDLHAPFWAAGKPPAWYADSVHLSDAGSLVAAQLIDSHAQFDRSLNPPSMPPVFSGSGDVMCWDKTMTGWTLWNTTAAQATGAGEFETGGSSLKLSTTSNSTTSFVYKDIVSAADIARFRGRHVTLLLRKRCLAGNPISCGRIIIYSFSGAGGETTYSDGSTLFGNLFHWQSLSFKVPVTANFIRVYIYTSGVIGQTGELFIDRMYLLPGLTGADGGPHRHQQSDIVNLTADLAAKAPLVHGHSGLAPTGGAAGQVLTKIDGSDFNFGWQTASGGGVADGDKGDVIVSANGTQWTLDAPQSLRSLSFIGRLAAFPLILP